MRANRRVRCEEEEPTLVIVVIGKVMLITTHDVDKYYPYYLCLSMFMTSFSIAPSLICIALSVAAASSGLCVTMIIVLLNSRDKSVNKLKTSIPVFVSKFPVGSSARIILGSFIRALAIATLCC